MTADSAFTPDRGLRVLVVDDEALNRMRIEDLLKHETGIAQVTSAPDGVAAIAAIRAEAPDIVFLDVQMPGKTGFEVVREIGADAMPVTIFVTAYDQYAVQAFDVAAVDYLVKPFDDERFEEAFRRARRALEAEGMGRLREQLLSVLQSSAAPAEPGGSPGGLPSGAPLAADAQRGQPYLERLAVEIRGSVRPVLVKDVDYITAAGPYAELHVAGRRYVIRETMKTLEDRLDPRKFMRVHRSVIVRLDLIESLERGAGGDGELHLKGGVRLHVSRTRREALEGWLGMT
ncbi:MAG: LytTR family DNA-binding domain-containing protein [bacterium]